MKFYKHQQELIDAAPDRHGIFHGMGTGKTLIAIELAKKKGVPTLVICPKTIKPAWLRHMQDFPYEYLVLTKEEFKKQEPKLKNYPCVIIDETHYFYGVKSQMHKCLLRYLRRYNTPYRYFCTGTVYLSTNWNVYAAAVLMGLLVDYQKFKYTFFQEIQMGHRWIWKDKRDPASRAALKQILDRIGTSVQISDVFDVPYQHNEEVYLEMSKEQEKLIKENYDPVAIVQWTAQHRIENSGGPKLEWLKEFAKTHKKFVVWCRYISQLDEIFEMLCKERKQFIYKVTGKVNNRDWVVRAANEIPESILLIQASCSEGYELPTFDTAVYASLSFSYKDLVQSQGRLLRANALHENTYYYLIMEGGVDEEVWKALQNKQDFSFELLTSSLLRRPD